MASVSLEDRKTASARFLAPISEIFGLSRATAIFALILTGGVLAFTVFWFFHSAPPRVLTITSGPPGSSFETNAFKYREILARNNIRLKIIPSQGSQENLQRLDNPTARVDVGFVQGGITNGFDKSKLVSLGSISYEPLLVFYRGPATNGPLSEFKGKRLAIGPTGSGTRDLALKLLALNGIEPGGATTLSDLEAGDAARALVAGSVDAVFLMGDSASPQIMHQLLTTPGIDILDFAQADGYTRRISYLNKLNLPMGSIDFGNNIPSHDLRLIGPTVELLARPDLHPVLSDMLLEAAREVHGGAKLLQRKSEFPAPLEHDYPLSADASRYYKSGKSFLYRSLPFWLASLVNRILVAFVPLIVVLIPGMRAVPALYRWRIRLRILRWYRALLEVERELSWQTGAVDRRELLSRLDQIEAAVNKLKLPASFADQFYGLRGDIGFVRARLNAPPKPLPDRPPER